MAQIIKLHHTVDAKHVRNIGEQSVSSSVQAINELVKNSYDADALSCKVHFYANSPLDQFLDVYKIVIEDTGVGMTFDDIERKWMRIATDTKEREKTSPKFGRRVSGEKGMGHFSAQKLGNMVKIISSPEMYRGRKPSKFSDKTLALTIDWNKYVPGKDFDEIENDLEVLDRDQDAGYGVTLEITDLKDRWTLADIENVRLNLGSLQSPKILKKNMKHPFEPSLVPHGFEMSESEVESSIEKFAPYMVTSRLRGNTVYYTIYARDRKTGERRVASDINSKAKGKNKFLVEGEACGNADFILYYYVGRVGEWAPKTVRNRRALEEQLNDNCGIKIFNDGIRIMPYGNPGNDWLGLGARKIARAGGKIRNEQSIGYVLLSRKTNPKIMETTTRQAVVENKAFETLKEKFVLQTIEEFESYLSEEKESESLFEVKENPKTKAASEIMQLTEFVESLPIGGEAKEEQKARLKEISSLIDQQEQKAEETVEKITTNLEMYRNLASLGISALAFHHEILQPLGRIESRQEMLRDKWEKWSDDKKLDYITKTLDDTYTIEDLNTYVREFASLFKGAKGTKRRREEIDIKKLLENMKEGFANILESNGVDIIIDQGPGSFSGLYMNKASFESIMLNLVSNSMRALNKVSRKEKTIKISYEKTTTNLKIWVHDNGVGIEEDNFERIFEPFWTTYKADHELGTGMGTTIVREIIEDDYGGTVTVDSSVYEGDVPGKGKTTFLITIPLENLRKGE